MKKNLWIAACMAVRGDEIHLKSEAFLAKSKADAYNIAYLNCHFEYPPESGFNNHLASVGEVPSEKLRSIMSAAD